MNAVDRTSRGSTARGTRGPPRPPPRPGPPGKQQTLLVALALEPGVPVTADRLVDALREDAPPPPAATTLRGVVSRLRQGLGGEDGPVDRRGTGYVLDLPAGCVGAHRFAHLAAAGRGALSANDPARARAEFISALALWRGTCSARSATPGSSPPWRLG